MVYHWLKHLPRFTQVICGIS